MNNTEKIIEKLTVDKSVAELLPYILVGGQKCYPRWFLLEHPSCTTNAAERIQVEAGEWICTVCNYLPKTTKVEEAGVNFNYYIERTNKIIAKVEGIKRPEKVIANQLNLEL